MQCKSTFHIYQCGKENEDVGATQFAIKKDEMEIIEEFDEDDFEGETFKIALYQQDRIQKTKQRVSNVTELSLPGYV